MSTCACTSGLDLKDCCGPFLDNSKWPDTAESLMRSRYSAYVLKKIDYVDKTHHPKFGGDFDKDEALKWANESEWMGLDIVKKSKGETQDDTGTVEFVAKYKNQGKDAKHHEIANFKKHNDKWYYTQGTIVGAEPIHRTEPKIGRNDPCSCGSGKKFKKCCL